MGVITEDSFKEVATRHYYDCKTEADVPCELYLHMYAGIYERNERTNCIINVHHPWDVRIWWCLYGSLRSCLCGYWCPTVHLESIGVGKEFKLSAEEFKFDCNSYCWAVTIPGRDITPDDCANPYKLVATVAYKSLCDKPGPILGYCELPIVTFYHSEK